jgi:hypothetical protein
MRVKDNDGACWKPLDDSDRNIPPSRIRDRSQTPMGELVCQHLCHASQPTSLSALGHQRTSKRGSGDVRLPLKSGRALRKQSMSAKCQKQTLAKGTLRAWHSI